MRISVRQPASEYKMMMWIQTPLTPENVEQEIIVEGYRMVLVAGEDGEHDTLITYIPKVQPGQTELLPAEYLNLRTLSALAWKYGRPFSQYLGFGGSPLLVWEGKPRPTLPHAGFYNLENVQYPPDPNARRALAFYRQGLIQADAFFKFLGYYRVVELAAGRGGGKAQVGWIMGVLPKIKDGEVQNRVGELSHVAPVGDYLYESGRCAVAHAGVNPRDPITDPDNPQDLDRILADMPVVKALAEYAIRFDFHVPR
jgi:hypothetical protein